MAAVHDGYVLQKSIVRSPLGGKLLSQCMAQSITSKGAEIQPNYSFKRVETSAGQYQVPLTASQPMKAFSPAGGQKIILGRLCSSSPIFDL